MYIMYHLFSLLSNLLCSNFKFHPLSNHRIQKIPLLKVVEIKVFRQLLQLLDHFRDLMKMVFYCLITEYFATASPMIWMESQLSELKIIGGYCGFMDTRVQPSGFL